LLYHIYPTITIITQLLAQATGRANFADFGLVLKRVQLVGAFRLNRAAECILASLKSNACALGPVKASELSGGHSAEDGGARRTSDIPDIGAVGCARDGSLGDGIIDGLTVTTSIA